jgi:hypothetical protein
MDIQAYQNPERGLDLVERTIQESGFSDESAIARTRSRDRDELYKKVFQYYDFLQRQFPMNIQWNDFDHFEYTEWDCASLVLNYYAGSGELSFTSVMFGKENRDKITELVQQVSAERPADIILPLPMGVLVPFLDVKKIGYWHFASNEGL